MAWAAKYRIEWDDISGVDWKVEIEEDGATTVWTLKATGDPLNIFWDNYADNIFDPLKPSEANLEVFSETNFAIADIYAIQDIQFRMSIYENESLRWRGFVNSRRYEEPYDCPPYPVKINAICGLDFLKDYLYASAVSIVDGIQDVTYYDDFRTEAQIITDILGKIGVTGFTEYINVYENSMDSSTSDSPLDQVAINTDVFRDFYCDEVLSQILSKYNACILQKNGGFVIYRPTELDGSNVAGRVFTSATAKTATTLHPEQYINRSTHPTSRVQVENGKMMILRPASQVTIYQNYKSRESWLDNFEFRADSWGGTFLTGYTAEDWTAVNSPGLAPVSYRIPEEADGAILMDHNNYTDYSKYIYQDFGSLAEITSDEVFGLSFDYQWINEQGSAAATQSFFFKVSIEAGANDYYLEKEAGSETTCVWNDNATPLYIEILEDVPDGLSGWKSWSRRIVSLPHAGPIRISFHCLNDAGPLIYMAIKNVRFIQTSNVMSFNTKIIGITSGDARMSTIYTYKDLDTIVEQTYVVTNNINGERREYKYILGDVVDSNITNILEQFNGALAVSNKVTAAANFVTDHAADYSDGGVTVTSSGNRIIFTGTFTELATITNTSGDLTGTVVNIQEGSAVQNKIVRAFPTDASGSYDITVTGCDNKTMTFDTNQADTCSGFVTDNVAYYNGLGITITSAQEVGSPFRWYVQFEAGSDIAVGKTNQVPAFDVTFETVQAYIAAIDRIDIITLSGASGTADILCDGETQEVSVALEPTSVWNTRGGSEAKELLKIIGDEIAAQYARPKQLIQMPIQETGSGVSQIDVVGSFQDDLNTYSGSNRKFVFNRGKWDTKMRHWEIDLCEIL